MLVLKNIAQLLTLKGGPGPRTGASMDDLGVIESGAVMIRGDRIVWVGSTRNLPIREPKEEHQILDAVGLGVVGLPGFVDSHTHPVFAGTRAAEYDLRARGKTYQEIAASGGGIASSVRQLRSATMDQLVERAERYFRMFLAHGTTTIEAKTGYGLTLEDEWKSLKTLALAKSHQRLEIIPTFLGAHAIPEEYRDSRETYIRLLIDEMIPKVAQEGLAEFCDVFCDHGYFSVEESRAILTAAKNAGLGLRIHAEELGHSGGAKLAAELGARSADHLEWIDDADIEALRNSGTVATLLPGTAFNLGLPRYPPARKLIDAGVPVALATDFNPGSCFNLNMQLILTIACSQMKMTPAEAITAATINSAYSLGISARVGSLEEGKQADIVLMDVGDYREIPYFFGINHCAAVIKKGNVIINRLESM
jgi:imidazolonepropionase